MRQFGSWVWGLGGEIGLPSILDQFYTTNPLNPTQPPLKNFLRYVYSGRLPANFKKTAEIYLPLAEKYDVPALKEECVSALGKRVDENNVVETLSLADLYRCPGLKRRCLRLIKKFGSALDRGELARLSPDLLIDVLTCQGEEEEEEDADVEEEEEEEEEEDDDDDQDDGVEE